MYIYLCGQILSMSKYKGFNIVTFHIYKWTFQTGDCLWGKFMNYFLKEIKSKFYFAFWNKTFWTFKKNVWTSDKSWEPDHYLMLSCSLTLSHSLALALSLFLTLTHFQSLIHSLTTCWTSFVFNKSCSACLERVKECESDRVIGRESLRVREWLLSKVTPSLSHSLILTCWTTFVLMYMLKSHSLTISLSHTFTLNHSIWTCWKTFVFMSMLKSHCL